MQYFITTFIVGLFLVFLLLMLFFTAGKKNRKQRSADKELVLACGDDGLINLFEQAESDNERDGIVEFIKEKLAREENGASSDFIDLSLAGELNAEMAEEVRQDPPELPERNIVSGLSVVPEQAHMNSTHTLAVEKIDWNAIEDDLQRRREEEERIMKENQHIQEVFSRIKEVENQLIPEQVNDTEV